MTYITIEEHILSEQQKNPNISLDLAQILMDLSLCSKLIRQQVVRFGLTDQAGRAGQENASGEDVQKLDVYANETVKQVIGKHGRFAMFASEEENDVVNCDAQGDYVILFDPLDGSSNIDVNVSVGTIFSVYKVAPGTQNCVEACLQPGSEQVMAGYVIYGSSVMLVYTAGQGVHGFTYDPSLGDFFLSHPSIRIPDKASCYSLNDALWDRLNPGLQAYISELRGYPKMSGRYVGSLVADFHRNLLKGGIYLYPGTVQSPQGKLRLLYEANPLAFVCEQAGGYASDGAQRILDLKPIELHQRVPLFIGNRALVEKLEVSLSASLVAFSIS